METQASDPAVEKRLKRIERTVPYLFRMNIGCLPGGGVPDCGGGDLRGGLPVHFSRRPLPEKMRNWCCREFGLVINLGCQYVQNESG